MSSWPFSGLSTDTSQLQSLCSIITALTKKFNSLSLIFVCLNKKLHCFVWCQNANAMNKSLYFFSFFFPPEFCDCHQWTSEFPEGIWLHDSYLQLQVWHDPSNVGTSESETQLTDWGPYDFRLIRFKILNNMFEILKEKNKNQQNYIKMWAREKNNKWPGSLEKELNWVFRNHHSLQSAERK